MAHEKITPLYERLSDSDYLLHGESDSISNQRKLLEEYAHRNCFPNPIHFTDDGISGTRFDRPGFTAMMKAVEAGWVEAIIVKDMSRLGRDYLKVGQIMETLHRKGVRLIAINDGVDSDNGEDDFAPFRNIINEFYPKDISRKTRSALYSKAMQGAFLASMAPFGYRKSPENKNQLIKDPTCAVIVVKIFEAIAQGKSLSEVAKQLHQEHVPTPRDTRKGTNNCCWSSATIGAIIRNKTYLGCTVYGKTKKLSYKSHKQIPCDMSEWNIVEGRHEAIVCQNLFDKANTEMSARKRCTRAGIRQMFSGLLICSTCGSPLNFCAEPRASNPCEGYYVCRQNKRFGNSACGRHYIRYSVLHDAVAQDVRYLVGLAQRNKQSLYNLILSQKQAEIAGKKEILETNCRACADEVKELKKVTAQLYRDHCAEKIDDFEYEQLFSQYSAELKKASTNLQQTQQLLADISATVFPIGLLVDAMISEKSEGLTRELLQNTIKSVEVNDKYFSSIHNGWLQKIVIHYKFVDLIREIIIEL